MHLRLFVFVALIQVSCRESKDQGDALIPSKTIPERSDFQTVTYELPWAADKAIRIFWQRSYPDDYSKLIEMSAESKDDPFASRIQVSDEELTPGDFGILGWDRAIIAQLFDSLGYPLGEGAQARLNNERVLIVTHSSEAFDALTNRFPELKPTRWEQGTAPQIRPPWWVGGLTGGGDVVELVKSR